MRARTAARRIALQALYQWDVRGEEFAGELDAFLRDGARSSEEEGFARELVLGVRGHLEGIDTRLRPLARHWSLDRMAAIDRNILRLAAFEMMLCDDIPPKVSINEAIDLAGRFSTEESGGFVNGILDPLMAELETTESEKDEDPVADTS